MKTKMKKKLLVFATLALVLSMLVAFVACGKPTPTPGGDIVKPPIVDPIKPVKAKVVSKDVYAMSAISSVGYLSSPGGKIGNASRFALALNADPATARPSELDKDIDKINDYVNMFKGLLIKNNDLGYVTSAPTAEDGIYATYKMKMVTKIPNADGTESSYIMYFNEVPQVPAEKPVDPEVKPTPDAPASAKADEGKEDDKDTVPPTTEEKPDAEEPDMETEVETELEGVLLYNNEKFIISGVKNIETEGTETETEITFTTKSDATPGNYIEVSQSIELNEVEYKYSIYENDTLVNETEIEFESENGEEELSIQFIDATGTPSETIYEMEKVLENGKTYFKISYSLNGTISSFKVTPSETANDYTYENGFTESKPI